MPSPVRHTGLRHRIRERLRLRSSSDDASPDGRLDSTPRTEPESSALAVNIASVSRNATLSVRNLSVAAPGEIPIIRDDTGRGQSDESTLLALSDTTGIEVDVHVDVDTAVDPGILDITNDSSDLWSAAYREAVNSLGEDINVAIFKGENVAQLFKQLGEMDKESAQDSAFVRGVKYLHSLQVPLENIKLALDLAAPLANVEPTAGTVFGVVRGVTAIAISVSTADIAFAKQIGEMLEQISYIDNCDTLGQKSNKPDIFKALVSVYRKLLEFFNAAFEILTRKGAKLVMKMVMAHDRLPKVVAEILQQADNLRRLVEKATWEIVEDIKAMLYDHESAFAVARWLDSGRFSRQSQRHTSLRDRCADQACEALLKDAALVSWYSAIDSQQLTILGDMGHGKTITMAFLIDELSRRSEHQLPQPKICYHYCQDEESGRVVCIFSTLILSLLSQLSGLKKIFFEWYKQTEASGIFDPAKNIKKLEEFLHDTIQSLDRPLFIVVDGLDECDRTSRNILLKSLSVLCGKTPRLKVLLSARPEEDILEQLNGVATIHLSSSSERDRIIVEKWVESQLYGLSNDVKELVSNKLSSLARGSAIWTTMVVQLIEVRRIRAFSPMEAFLENIPQPGQLLELYASLFSRYTANDTENQQLAKTALELLAVAQRPLSVLELAWAVAMGVAPDGISTIAALKQLVDHQRLLSLIQPFIARVDFNDMNKRQVRLVHKSARDFVIHGWAIVSPVGAYISTTAATGELRVEQRVASLEAALLNICVRYLLLEDMDQRELFSDEQFAMEELLQDYDSDLFDDNNESADYDPDCSWEVWEKDMKHYDPAERGFGELFVYASCHWTDHFGAIKTEPPPGSIETLCKKGTKRLQNWINQNCRPGCTIKPRFTFDSSLYDPLAITSLYGSHIAFQHMLENADFGSSDFFTNTAMKAADQIFQWGDLSRISTMFTQSAIGRQLWNVNFFQLVIKYWSVSKKQSQGQDWDVVFELVGCVLDNMVQDSWGNELLCLASGSGCMPIVRRLMDAAQNRPDLREELFRDCQRQSKSSFLNRTTHQSIGEAVLGNHVDVVEYLLGQQGIDAHLRHRNIRGENVLHLASRECNPDILRLLTFR